MTDKIDTSPEALNPEEHADGFTPFWGYVVGFDKYADLSARVTELDAKLDKAVMALEAMKPATQQLSDPRLENTIRATLAEIQDG